MLFTSDFHTNTLYALSFRFPYQHPVSTFLQISIPTSCMHFPSDFHTNIVCTFLQISIPTPCTHFPSDFHTNILYALSFRFPYQHPVSTFLQISIPTLYALSFRFPYQHPVSTFLQISIRTSCTHFSPIRATCPCVVLVHTGQHRIYKYGKLCTLPVGPR
jgi:hypothetical protein